MPPSVRFLPFGDIEYLCRHELAQAPEFTERYREARRHGRRQLGMVQIGTR